MQKGLVSTIIPVYNRPDMLIEAVQSVLDQSYRPIEIIIVDDGSTDQTPSVAQSLAKNYREIISLSINSSGPGIAREAGRKIAKGEYIQYLDSDDLLVDTKFTTQVSGLIENPECGVSYCRQHYCDMHGVVIDDAWMRSAEHHQQMFPAMLAGRLWGTPSPIYRKALLDLCGPWLDLKSEEDWEYDCRVASKGVQLHYTPEPLTIIRKHDGIHFGQVSQNETSKLQDRAKAYSAILKHALDAGINQKCWEFQRFIRMTFMLSRKCGTAGLPNEAKFLFNIARKYRASSNRNSFEYFLYRVGTKFIGWRNMGILSDKLDKFRS